jgi:hypothetical protein
MWGELIMPVSMRIPVSPARAALGTLALGMALSAGCSIFAAKDDYAAYRQIRVAQTDRERAVAMAHYIEEHPEGEWASSVQKKRARAEDPLFESSKATIDGLRFYLEAYPEGKYAEQARARLEALGTVAERKQTEQKAEREVEREQREEAINRRRQWASRAVSFWVKTLLEVDRWGQPIAAVAKNNPEFNRAFGKNPRPRCSRTECIKFYQLRYGIPVPGQTQIERTVELLLRLKLEEGKLVRAEVLMPEKGFSRWFELEKQTLVTDEDPAQRNEAIEFALSRIVPAVKAAAPGASNYDVIPEPIEPPEVRAPNQPDPGASNLPGQEAPTEPADAGEDASDAEEPGQGSEADGREAAGEGGEGQLDELLDRAVGDEGQEPEPEAEPDPEPEPETMMLPIAIQGFQTDSLIVGVFAAPTDDYGRAYDGLFMELAEREAAEGEGDEASSDDAAAPDAD